MPIAPHPVHLVGAGPGDPELLTLKALRVLREASVILVDDLVGEGVLEAALDGATAPARIVHVGKRGGCASTPQDFIEKLMVREALAGERVVRLKGGDPLVFGRAGEEIAALRASGLEVVVVNGITSGLGAAASLGIGWTDRRAHAQGVLLVTGHTGRDCKGQDWDAVARVAATGVTLVIYMGIAQVDAIAERERSACTTLDGVAALVASQGLGSPAILIVGRVVDAARVAADAMRSEARHAAS